MKNFVSPHSSWGCQEEFSVTGTCHKSPPKGETFQKFVMVNQCVCHGLNNDRRYVKTWDWLLATNDSQMLKYNSQFKRKKRKKRKPQAVWQEGAITSLQTLEISISGTRLGTSWMLFPTLWSDKAPFLSGRMESMRLSFLSQCRGGTLGFATLVTLWFIRAWLWFSRLFADCRTPFRAAS